MKNLQIYDNGGISLDRYTIFKAREKFSRFDRYGNKLFMGISASETGCGVFMYIEAAKGPHLGKRVDFNELDKELQNRLRNEFEK